MKGLPGCGKTSIARIIAAELCPKLAKEILATAWCDRSFFDYYEYCSADYTIGFVRELRNILGTSSWYGRKIVFLDEAQGITKRVEDGALEVFRGFSG